MKMPQHSTISRACRRVFADTPIFALIGAPIAIVVAFQYGLPTHGIITFLVMAFVTGLGITLGFHRLFSHRSFATSRLAEWLLMILGCMSGQNSPFFWVAHHRTHHRHSDHDGDPHSPYIWAGRRLGLLRGFWHSYSGWWHHANEYNYPNGYNYHTTSVCDLARRPDLAWIDRHWFHFYLLGLLIPALAGFAIGGTGYDALVGLLWGAERFGSSLAFKRLGRSTLSVTSGATVHTIPRMTAGTAWCLGSLPSAMVGTTITTPSRLPLVMDSTGGSRTSHGA
jgi:stearoyl-CoA desaturase (delta-9 desaturase)